MIKSTKIISSVVLALALSACASTSPKIQISENLAVAPAIDVPYNEVNKNINGNIGVNVRWGGEIVRSRKVGDMAELTILSTQLDNNSQPIPRSVDDFADRRFIVIVPEHDNTLLRQYFTVFGSVSGERTLVNGPRTKVIPVITAIETMAWDPKASSRKSSLAHSKLDRRSRHYNSFNQFNNRGFTSFNNFGRFSSFGHFNSFSRFNGLGRSRFNRGFRSSSRFGRGSFFGGH